MNLAWIEVDYKSLATVKAFGKFNGQLWKFSHIADVNDCYIKAYYLPLNGTDLELVKVATTDTDPKYRMGKMNDLIADIGGKVTKSGDGEIVHFT